MDINRLRKEIAGENIPLQITETTMAHHIYQEEAKKDKDLPPDMKDRYILGQIRAILQQRIDDGDVEALFQLGQLHFEQEEFNVAASYFERAASKGDYQAMFQLGVIYYDGLNGVPMPELGLSNMKKVATSTSAKAKHLIYAAQFNVGRAFFQGYGTRASDEEAEKWWLKAANDGDPKGSIKAQCMLGMYYSLTDSLNLKKSFFWHNEACGNGSLESQGALGVMYMYGLGTKKNLDSAFICLREAAQRGNVYAMGHLISYYYNRKLYTKAVDLAARVVQLDDVECVANDSGCLPTYVAKGAAMACFYYARCLHQGFGLDKDEQEAKIYYSKSFQFDPDVCALLQNTTTFGYI